MFVISALCSIYFAVFLDFVLPLYVVLCWAFGRYRFDRRALWGLVATGAVATAALMPVISHYLRFNADYTPAFPGVVAIALAIYAIIVARREDESRRVVWLLASFAVISYLLALGPLLKPLNLNPAPFAKWLPMPGKIWLVVPGIRWPMRIFFFAWLAGAILCGLGLTALERRHTRWRRAIAPCAIFLIVVEYWPSSWLAGRSAAAAPPMELSDAYPYLARETDRGGVVELPEADKSGWRTPFSTRYIYASAGHLFRVPGSRPARSLHWDPR